MSLRSDPELGETCSGTSERGGLLVTVIVEMTGGEFKLTRGLKVLSDVQFTEFA